MIEPSKAKKLVKAVLLIMGLVFIAIVASYLLKGLNGESCGYDTHTFYDGGALQLAATLATTNSYILQHIPHSINEKKYTDNYFCFTANATEGVEIKIITTDKTLATVVIGQSYEKHCYNIPIAKNDTLNYIGVKCPSCSAANPKVMFYEEILGVNVERIVKGVSTTVSDSNTLDFTIRSYNSCWNSVKYFSNWYITLCVFMLLIMGVSVGYKKLKEVVLSD